MLIPAYKDMDPYDLPEEFSHLQAQDMSKLGFMQDLIRGIKKIAEVDTPKVAVVKETVHTAEATNTAPLLKRAFMFLEDEDWKSANEYCEKVLDINPECAMAYLGKLLSELRVRNQKSLGDQAEPFDGNNNYQKAIRFADENLKTELVGYIDYINDRNENTRLDGIYNRAQKAMSAANTENIFKEVADLFETISGYKDSDELCKKCRERAEEEKKRLEDEKKRFEALIKEYKAAIQNENSAENIKVEVNEILSSINKRQKDLHNLKNAWEGIENELFSTNEILKSIQAEIVSINNEMSNLSFFAVKRKKAIKDRIDYLGLEQQSTANKVDKLQKKKMGYNNISEVDNAIDSNLKQIEEQKNKLEELSCTRSSIVIRKELCTLKLGKWFIENFECLQNIKKGSYITFGAYEQDNNISNGKEDVEWLVLEVKDGKALVISKYALDYKKINASVTSVTWETCTLRKWLNSDFINSAFTAEEKEMIPTVTVSADKNPGNTTQDQVFLLSITEANKYFSSDSVRNCKPTEYAVAVGAHAFSYNGNCSWWLRSLGRHQLLPAYVDVYGDVIERGPLINNNTHAVRPALWIDLNYLVF